MASPAAVLNILITANSTQANAQLAKTQATLQRTTATANTASTAVGTRLAGAAKMGAAAVGVGLVYGLGKAVAAGANFEKQMDSVGAVADANTKQMKRLEKQALSLGQKTQYSAQEVAQAQEALVKGGLKLKDVLGGALPASLSLAAAGQMELADASATTVNAMKLFGLEGNKAMQVADMLATAANKTTADVSDFAMALQQGGSAAKAAGYDLNDTITILEALAEVGIKNSDAGTSMKTAFLQLLAPTSKQAELAKKLNLEFVDQNGNLKDAAALSKELHGALDGMTKSQQAANLKLLAGTDGFRTLNALLAESPNQFRELTKANAENGTANDIAKQKMDNLAGSVEQLKGALETLAIKVSAAINPALRDAVDWLTQAVTDISNIDLGSLDKSGKDVESFGQAMHNLGVAVKAAWDGFIRPVLEKMGPAIETWLKGFLRGLTGLIEIISGVLTLDLKQALDGMVDVVKGFSGMILGTVKYLSAPFRTAFAKLGELAATAFKAPVMGIVGAVRFVFDKTMGVISSALRVAASIADKLSGIPLIGDKFDGLGEAATGAADRIDGFRDSLRGDDSAIAKEAKALEDLGKVFKELGKTVGEFSDDVADGVDKVTKNFDRTSDKARSMAGKVGSSVTNLANVVKGGFQNIGDNTVEMLGKLGVKKGVSFSLKSVGNAAKGFQTGGVIVPGQGDGDKVPALLEPGEVVLNKKAVAAMGGASRANSINKKIPRFQKGGVAAMTSLANAFDRANEPYSLGGGHGSFLTSPAPVDCSGAVSAILHAGGLLNGAPMDTVALAGWGKPARGNENLVVATRPITGSGGHTVMKFNGRVFGTSGENPAGGAGYLSSSNPRDYVSGAVLRTMDIAGGVASEIARVLLKGPDGPLKSMGQAALDKVRSAANKFIASKMPMGSGGGGDAGGMPIKSLPANLQKYNHQWGYDSTDAIPSSAVKAMTRWQGLPSWFWKIAIGESHFQPGAVGHDPNGYSTGYGLFQETEPFANPYLRAVTGGLNFNDWLNPIINTMSARKHFDAAASQVPNTVGFPWYGTTGLQQGGIIQKFAKGGKAKKDLHGSVSGGTSDPAWRRFTRARNIAKRLSGILGDKGRVAQIDERISMAETLASLDSSEMGSDMSPAELAKQIGLNERLLEVLTRAKKLSRSGLKELDFPKSMSTTAVGKGQLKNLRGVFGGYLTDLTGVTGKGGRIFETMVTLDQLRNTSTATDNSAQLSDLASLLAAANARYAVSQAQYAAFDGFRAKGGSVAPGKWAIAGERGPEVVSGPATVTPISGRPSLTIEELTVYTDGRVGMKYEGREFEVAVQKVNRKQARSGARVLPGRAGS